MMWKGDPHSRWHCRGHSLVVWFCRMGNVCMLNSFLRQPALLKNIWPPWASKKVSECPSPRSSHTEISFQMQMNGIILYYGVYGSTASSILSPPHSMLLPAFPWVYIQSSFFSSPVLFAMWHGDKNNWKYCTCKYMRSSEVNNHTTHRILSSSCSRYCFLTAFRGEAISMSHVLPVLHVHSFPGTCRNLALRTKCPYTNSCIFLHISCLFFFLSF